MNNVQCGMNNDVCTLLKITIFAEEKNNNKINKQK